MRRRVVLLAAAGAGGALAQGGHEAAARLLIERGADVNAQDEIQDSAFLLAGARGHTGIVRAALAATPPPDFNASIAMAAPR